MSHGRRTSRATRRSALALLALAACTTSSSPGSQPSASLSGVAAPASSAPLPADGTRRAIYRSSDRGETWTRADGSLPEGIEVGSMVRWGSRLLVGTDAHGVLVGDVTHEDWTSIGEALPGVKITALAVDGEQIYAGVLAAGAFVTRDRGVTWASLSEGLDDLRVRAILPLDGALLVGTDTGISRQSSGRPGWHSVFADAQVISLDGVESAIVAGTARGALLSTDGGATWRWIHEQGAAHEVAVIDSTIALMNISGDLHLSNDQGQTWRTPSYAPRDGSYVYDVAAVGDALIASNNYGIHRSEDGGATWRLVHATEALVFFDLVEIDGVLFGGTRTWKERRGKQL